jgi:hypothetical protein
MTHPTLAPHPPSPTTSTAQSVLVMAQLRQVAHELRDAMAGHWALNASVSVDEVLREITPEEVRWSVDWCLQGVGGAFESDLI